MANWKTIARSALEHGAKMLKKGRDVLIDYPQLIPAIAQGRILVPFDLLVKEASAEIKNSGSQVELISISASEIGGVRIVAKIHQGLFFGATAALDIQAPVLSLLPDRADIVFKVSDNIQVSYEGWIGTVLSSVSSALARKLIRNAANIAAANFAAVDPSKWPDVSVNLMSFPAVRMAIDNGLLNVVDFGALEIEKTGFIIPVSMRRIN
jgi:hypothetical protein